MLFHVSLTGELPGNVCVRACVGAQIRESSGGGGSIAPRLIIMFIPQVREAPFCF